MKKSVRVALAAGIAIAAIVSILAVATHFRESAEDAGKQGPENESPVQALKETLSNGAESEANEQGENEAAENG